MLPAFVYVYLSTCRKIEIRTIATDFTLKYVTGNKRNDKRFTPLKDENLLLSQVQSVISSSRRETSMLRMARHLL